jgi:hypothetical protein
LDVSDYAISALAIAVHQNNLARYASRDERREASRSNSPGSNDTYLHVTTSAISLILDAMGIDFERLPQVRPTGSVFIELRFLC